MLDARSMRGKVYPAVPVPFDFQHRLAETAQREYAAWMARQPIGGVAVWVHTGRGLFLTSEQREFVFRSWREALPASLSVIAGAGALASTGRDEEGYLQEAVAMAHEARRLGADALLCFPPVLFRQAAHRAERVLEYHRRLAEVGLPLILFYLYEAAGGISYAPALLEQLFALPQTIGIKMATLDSVMTFQNTSRLLLERFPEKTLVTGEDRFLGYSLVRGASAALVGMGAACTRVQCELLDAAQSQDWNRLVPLLQQVDDLAEHTFIPPMEGYVQRMMWALAHHGVLDRSVTCDPWGPALPETEFAALGECLRRYERW